MGYISDDTRKVTTHRLIEMKQRGEKISMLTSYDYTMAQIVDGAGVDVILVGDSASNVMAGNVTTLPITLDQMIYHGKSVVRGVKRAMVIVDMPFGSYQGNELEGLASAIRIMKESHADALKLEGGEEIIGTVKRILSAGIPIMGHLGLMPQSINKYGTYTVRAKDDAEAEKLVRDAHLLEEAGCFGASNDTLPYARDFMQVILLGTPVTYTMIGQNNIMRATGYPKKAMLTSMVTVVCNIILAPIFIFQFDWGIRGAATATVISQFIGMVWVVSHFLQKTSVVRLQRGFWKMKKRIISSILSIGMSPFLMNVTACVIVIIVNNSLQQYGGDMAIGAYGIINRLLVLYVMIVLGLTMGMQPIVGYNFGAQKHDRVKATLRLTIIAGVCITSTGFLICELFPHAISAIFTSDEELIDIASRGVRIAVAIFPLVGAQIVIGNFFQSIGKAKISIFLSLTRQLLYLLPGLLIFPHYFGLDGIWICMPVSDFFAFVTAAVALWIYVKRLPTGITEKAR
jgi:3-methyl-2-oxobutanoate hydroxymethyltransferase